MTLYHFALSGVIEVDPEALRIAAANRFLGDTPSDASFEHGLQWRSASAEDALTMLVGSLINNLSKRVEEAGGEYDYHALTFQAVEVKGHRPPN